jgi:hypothetical protein
MNFINAAINEGLSKSQTIRELRERNEGYRTATFNKDYDILAGAKDLHAGMKNIGRDRTVGAKWYPKAATELVSGKYQTVMELRGIDLDTGDAFTRHVTVSHDDFLTRGELESDALSWTADYTENYRYDKIIPVKARRSIGLVL